MALSKKLVIAVAVVGIGALALYLYLKRAPASSPSVDPLADTSEAQITASHLGIAGDDPSTVRGDLRGGMFQVSSTENRPAIETFLGKSFTGTGGTRTTNPIPV